MKTFKEFITEGNIRKPGLAKKASSVDYNDKEWDAVYSFDNLGLFYKFAQQLSIITAHENVWKTDYNKDDLKIYVKWEK